MSDCENLIYSVVKPKHNLLCADKADLSKQFREFAVLQAVCECSFKCREFI